MTHIIAVGLQWGDEGKGKVVDWLSQKTDIAVRFQGGNNAGHTVLVNSHPYHLSLLPSSVLHPQTLSILGNGVVIDPWRLSQEIDALRQRGVKISPKNFLISDNAALILPLHRQIDHAWETFLRRKALGTTKQGVGPAYEDKVARRAIRVCDLNDSALLKEKVRVLLSYHNLFLKHAGFEEQKERDLLDALREIKPSISPYVRCTWQILKQAREDGKSVIFEGAQGALLDLDHGTFPFVTASNTIAAQALIGTGTPLGAIDSILGIAKAYATRVGNGPFPTAIQDQTIARHIATQGQEIGTVTGRERRVGWFDAVAARQAIHISGITSLAVTKLDILDHIAPLKICTHYRYKQDLLSYLPQEQSIQRRLTPVYEELDGWRESTSALCLWSRLPRAAQTYLQRLETLLQIPISLISTSPHRAHMIVRRDPFAP